MPGEHPFQQLFENFGKLPAAHSDFVNREARETLMGWLSAATEKPGHCILLKAPRAGHGKTHLLTSLQHQLGGTHEFVPLHAVGGSRIDAATVLDDTLRGLVRSLPAAGGLTVLDLVARRLFSSALQPLVNSGEVPCQDREGALSALRSRPIETFDFHHPSAVTAHWARENFELLGPRLALELSQKTKLPLREVSFWVDAMFRFAATAVDNPGRVRALAATVFDEPSAESAAHERLVALLGLMCTMMRVVLVADELEGFSSDEAAALRLASFLGSLRQSVERADVILSVNQDVWESAFLPRLSGGLADRLSEVTVELAPLDRKGILSILESRSPGMGEKILASMGSDWLPTHARGVVKKAAESWGLEPSSVVEHVPGEEPPAEPVVSQPEPDFVAEPVAASAGVEDAPDAPTQFSPEAAIAAFNAIEPSSDPDFQPAPEAASPAPASAEMPAESFPPAPPADFAVPPVESQPPAPVDSPFQIDTQADPAVQAFQVDPATLESGGVADDQASTDRVDNLLKQFRERYGKP